MRILLIHQIFVTPDEGGGTRHYEMCKYLVHHGHQVTVIGSDIDYLSGEKRENKSEFRDGMQIYYIKASKDIHKSIIHRALNFFSFSYNAYKFGKSLLNIDIIWGTTPPLFQTLSALLIAKKRQIVFLIEVRDLWLDFAKQLGIVTNPFIFRFFKLVERMIYRKADRLIVNSPGFISHINKIVPNKKIEVFPNGVDISDYKAVSNKKVDNFIRRYSLENKFVVMYTGNLGMANDIENILLAAQNLKDKYPEIRIVFVGGGLNTEKYKQGVKDESLFNVQFIKSQPKKEMPNILNVADVCLATLKNIPLFNTNYPNKVFDYMAAGKPTILAIDGAMRDVIEKSQGGRFIQPGDSQKLTEAILYYYNNRDIIIQQGQNARKFVTENFDRKDISANFNNYLESIISNENN